MEKSRAELQAEHRRQTAELVELRAKVAESEEQRDAAAAVSSDGGEEEEGALRVELERLKAELKDNERLGSMSEEQEQAVASLVREKEELENELRAQKQQHENSLRRRARIAAKVPTTDQGLDVRAVISTGQL